jgi:uncharacterized membrane protein
MSDSDDLGLITANTPPPSGGGLDGPERPVLIQQYLSDGWRLLMANPGLNIGYTLFFLVVMYALQWLPLIGQVAAILLSGPLTGGFYLAMRKQLFGSNVQFGDYLLGFNKPAQLVLVGAVSGLLIGVGCLLLLLPGIYLAVAYLFAIVLAADRDLTFWDAMEGSRKFITRQWIPFFMLALLLFVANMVGAMVFGLGLLISIPFSIATVLSAYHHQIGLQSPAP